MVWNTEPLPTQSNAFIGNNTVNHTFLFNPDEVKWNYSNNTVSRDTIGGRVVQLLSAKVEQMIVSGKAGSRAELQRLALNLKQIMDWQIKTQAPVSFKVPSRKWNFKVYLQNVSSLGWDYAATSYPYELTLLVQEDLTKLTNKAIQAQTLQRLAAGIGYVDKFHSGDSEEALAISEAYRNSMGLLQNGSAGSTAAQDGTVSGDTSGGSDKSAGSQLYKNGSMWKNPTIAGLSWTGANLREAVINMLTEYSKKSNGKFSTLDIQVGLCLIKHESGWDRYSKNDNTNDTIDYGLWQLNSSHDTPTNLWWPNDINRLYNAEYNTRAALHHWNDTQGWEDWSTYNSNTGCLPS